MLNDHSNRTPPCIVAIVGKSNSGKTTLLEKLIPELKRRGYRVGTVKHHAHPGFEVDKPGKDTWRHAKAGAGAVAMVSPGKMFVLRNTEGEIPLEEIPQILGEVDIVLAEGFFRSSGPKVEVLPSTHGSEPLCSPEELVALVTDVDLALDVPKFSRDDIDGLANLLERDFLSRK